MRGMHMVCVNVCVCIRSEVWIGSRGKVTPGYWKESVIPFTCLWASLAILSLGHCRKTLLSWHWAHALWRDLVSASPPVISKRPYFICDDILPPLEKELNETVSSFIHQFLVFKLLFSGLEYSVEHVEVVNHCFPTAALGWEKSGTVCTRNCRNVSMCSADILIPIVVIQKHITAYTPYGP